MGSIISNYISTKTSSKESDKEENTELIGAATNFYLERRL
jgi:hypothetical protein